MLTRIPRADRRILSAAPVTLAAAVALAFAAPCVHAPADAGIGGAVVAYASEAAISSSADPGTGFGRILVPDLDAVGSVSVTMADPETLRVVSGGTLTLYRVADVRLDNDADYSFELTEDFAGSTADLTGALDADLARGLADYAADAGLTGVTREVSSDGLVRFSDLAPGLFLLVQHLAAEGYYEVSPFLVSIPLEEDGAYVYDVDATPKMELLKEKPEEPGTPEEPGVPGTPDMPKTADATEALPGALALAGALTSLGAGGALLLRRLRVREER